MEHLKKESEIEKNYLKNIGLTDKTNQLLHLRHKQIKKRYRDSNVAKDLETRAWADPAEVIIEKDKTLSDTNKKAKSMRKLLGV